jgi:hypothetical protein
MLIPTVHPGDRIRPIPDICHSWIAGIGPLVTPRIAWSMWKVIFVLATLLEEISDSTPVTVPARVHPDWRVRRRKVFSATGGG